MKKSFGLAFLLPALAFATPGAQWRPVPNQDPSVRFRTNAVMSSDQGSYTLRLTKKAASATAPEYMEFHMTEPGAYGNFTALVQFFKLEVNGIKMSLIELEEEDLSADNGKCSMKMDYDDAQFRLDWYMKDGSPLLYCDVTKLSGEVKSCRIQIDSGPNGFVLDEKGGLIRSSEEYLRRADTPSGTLNARPETYKLKEKDSWAVLYDTLTGKNKRTKAGPCLVAWKPEALLAAKLTMRQEWVANLELILKPDFTTFTFALWQTSTPDFALPKAREIAEGF